MRSVAFAYSKAMISQNQKLLSKSVRTLQQVRSPSDIYIYFFFRRVVVTHFDFFLLSELKAFNTVVNQLSQAMSERSKSIDKIKLQAIGQRNIYESERAERKRKRTELTNLIKEKLRELDRQTAQLDSLTQVENEQKALIEKLTSSE